MNLLHDFTPMITPDTFLIMWLNICLTLLGSKKTVQIFISLIQGISWDVYTGNVLYEIAKLYNPRTIWDKIKWSTNPTCNDAFYEKGPKWAAAILKLETSEFPYDHEISTFISHIDIKYYSKYEQAWKELPFLLREYIRLNQDDYVIKALSQIELNKRNLQSQEIYEYISIANAVRNSSFLERVYKLAKSDMYHKHYLKLTLHVAAILLESDNTNIDRNVLYALFPKPVDFFDFSDANLLALYKVAIHAYIDNNIEFEDNYGKFSNILRVYIQSPLTAIRFLHAYLPKSNKPRSKNTLMIQQLVRYAESHGQTEEANLLQELL